jgi:hypothetical protein
MLTAQQMQVRTAARRPPSCRCLPAGAFARATCLAHLICTSNNDSTIISLYLTNQHRSRGTCWLSVTPQPATHVAACRLRVIQHLLCQRHFHASCLGLCTPTAAVLAGLASTARPQLTVILLGCWRKGGGRDRRQQETNRNAALNAQSHHMLLRGVCTCAGSFACMQCYFFLTSRRIARQQP